MPSLHIMFSTIIVFQFIFSSIINCHQNDNNELEECKKLFVAGDDERIKDVLHPLADSIKNFKIEKPNDYFDIFPKYKDAIINHKTALSPSKKRWGIFPSNNIVPDSGFQDIQKKNNERGQTINTFEENIDIKTRKRKPFMKALKKPLEYNCLLNHILKGKTIQQGLDIIMNGKIECNNDETKKNHSDLCNRINIFLEEIGFFKDSAIKPNLETITVFKPKAKKVSKKPNLDAIPEGQNIWK